MEPVLQSCCCINVHLDICVTTYATSMSTAPDDWCTCGWLAGPHSLSPMLIYGPCITWCVQAPLVGKRYRCLICADYDLCEGCFNQGQHAQVSLMHPGWVTIKLAPSIVLLRKCCCAPVTV
jgi:hypothetical protein